LSYGAEGEVVLGGLRAGVYELRPLFDVDADQRALVSGAPCGRAGLASGEVVVKVVGQK
jgi:hypothetical protein